MSIIFRKKQGILVPKTNNPPTPQQILGNIGLGAVLGITLGKKKAELINNLINETVERLIMEKLFLISPSSIKKLEYFVSYQLIDGKKTVKTLFLKKKIWMSFVRISYDEMILTGTKSSDFLSFLENKQCKKIKISREQLENYI